MTDGIQSTIHVLSQILLVPVMVVLLLFAAYAVVELGSLLVEGLSERRRFKATVPRFTRAVSDAAPAQVEAVIEGSGLLRRQRGALSEVFSMRDMRPDVREALAGRLLAEEELRYRRTLMRSDFATRAAPMFGLMGTLIPLGPGVMALSSGDMATLSNSLVVAFDTTVAGLIVSAVAFGISKLRRHWYEDYMSALEAAMNIVLDKAASLELWDAGASAGRMPSAATDDGKDATAAEPPAARRRAGREASHG
jgi:biopolymer transport protein ExbB/TolQ